VTPQTSSSRISPAQPSPEEDFATLVARFRRARGLSQGQLAKAARLSRTYIYHLETGQRRAPSIRVARAVARALELHGEDRQKLARAYLNLTGKQMEDEAEALDLLDQRELAAVLVRNMVFPAHSLDRLWNVSAWNRAAKELFETDATRLAAHSQNLLIMVFDPVYRARFRPWEALARRLLAEFKYATRSLTYLPEYRTLWRSLRLMPDFTRIADTSDPGSGAAPGLIFQMRHSRLGPLTLRTTVTVFSGASDYSIVTYVPGDQQTLNTFAANGWQAPEQNLDA
jgi:transcriptional regulator with XRE-family HTH domain